MARSRNLKPGFFVNDQLAELPPLVRLLFAGLWTIADRAGRMEDRPKKIKAQVLPYDDLDIDAALNLLQKAGFIQRYQVASEQYIQIVSFEKHQNPHKNEAPSTIPFQEQHRTSTVQATAPHSSNPADSFNPITDSFNPIKPTASRKRSAEKQGARLPDNWHPSPELIAWAVAERPGIDIQRTIDNFTDYWRAVPGQRGRKLDWDATFRNRVRDENTGKTQHRTGPTAIRESRIERSDRKIREALAECEAQESHGGPVGAAFSDLRGTVAIGLR